MKKMAMMVMETSNLDEVIARLCPGMRSNTVKRHLSIRSGGIEIQHNFKIKNIIK